MISRILKQLLAFLLIALAIWLTYWLYIGSTSMFMNKLPASYNSSKRPDDLIRIFPFAGQPYLRGPIKIVMVEFIRKKIKEKYIQQYNHDGDITSHQHYRNGKLIFSQTTTGSGKRKARSYIITRYQDGKITHKAVITEKWKFRNNQWKMNTTQLIKVGLHGDKIKLDEIYSRDWLLIQRKVTFTTKNFTIIASNTYIYDMFRRLEHHQVKRITRDLKTKKETIHTTTNKYFYFLGQVKIKSSACRDAKWCDKVVTKIRYSGPYDRYYNPRSRSMTRTLTKTRSLIWRKNTGVKQQTSIFTYRYHITLNPAQLNKTR